MPRHFNKVIAETMYENIKQIGLPEWSEEDQLLAKAIQHEVNTLLVKLIYFKCEISMCAAESQKMLTNDRQRSHHC